MAKHEQALASSSKLGSTTERGAVTQALSLRDARRVWEAVEECCEMWDDAPAWQHHLAASVERLGGGILGAMMIHAGHESFDTGLGERWDETSARIWTEFVASGGAMTTPGGEKVRETVLANGWFSGRTMELSSPSAYLGSELFQRFLAPAGAYDALIASTLCARVPFGRVPPLLSVALLRTRTEPCFDERAQTVIGALVCSVGQRVGSRLATSADHGRHGLPPRIRQTLDALLEGDSEKQVAARLGIHISTVHDYVKVLHARFGVQSRAELLAYFVRRAPRPQAKRANAK
jgi:DNA-binding CsgD family transcriptional regulator